MPASTSRRVGPIGPIELATITSFFVGGMPGRNVQNIPPIFVLILRVQRLALRITAGRSDPHPGVTLGVAEGAKDGGRSCPLSGEPERSNARQNSAAES